MLTSKLEEKTPPQPPEKPFPKMMRNGTLVVLFVNPRKGTVVAGDTIHTIGLTYTNWLMSRFTDFTGSVILTQD